MLVKDVMTKNPISVKPDMSVLEAKEIMNKNKINKLPVLDKNGSLVGIITRNDLVKASPSEATTLDMFELGYLLSKLTVEKAMKKDVKTVQENETVENAASLMRDYSVGSLVVLKDDLMVGIITETDLFECFIEMFKTKTEGIRVTLILDEKPGQIAKLSALIAEASGNIVSMVTADTIENNARKVIVKITNITEDQFRKIAIACDAKIEDIR